MTGQCSVSGLHWGRGQRRIPGPQGRTEVTGAVDSGPVASQRERSDMGDIQGLMSGVRVAVMES